jgi:YHS domain-containing protein
MLNKYSCQIQPKIHSELFPYFEQAIGRRRILDKWFYFYIIQPEKPVIIWKSKSRQDWQLQPGTNRYIGVALRDSKEWIDGVLITDDNILTHEIKNLILLESQNLKITDYQITLNNPVHKWGVGDQTLYNSDWIQPVYNWIHTNVKHRWGLKYKGKTYYVSSERRFTSVFKKTKKILNAEDYPNIQLAVQALFQEIKLNEF